MPQQSGPTTVSLPQHTSSALPFCGKAHCRTPKLGQSSESEWAYTLSHRSKHSRAAPKMFRGRTKTPKTQDMETAHTATKQPLSAKPSNAPRTSSKQGRATTTWVDIPSLIQRLSPPPGPPTHGTGHTLPSEERPAGDPGSQALNFPSRKSKTYL